MENLILFCIAVIGATHIIVDGKIFQPVRDFVVKYLPAKLSELLSCYQCCGTWMGFLLGFLISGPDIIKIFLCGCSGSFLSSWGAIYLNYLEAQTIISLPDDNG